jgi:hypothetical protein
MEELFLTTIFKKKALFTLFCGFVEVRPVVDVEELGEELRHPRDEVSFIQLMLTLSRSQAQLQRSETSVHGPGRN